MALDTEHWMPVFGKVKGVDSIKVLGAWELGTPTIVAPIFQMLFLGKNARPEIAESIARECLGSVEQGYGLSSEQAELLFRQMWPVACGIMSIIKSGEEVENVRPHKR